MLQPYLPAQLLALLLKLLPILVVYSGRLVIYPSQRNTGHLCIEDH